MLNEAHEMRQRARPKGNSGVAARETQAGLHFGNLGAADRHAVRRRAVELDHGAIALLADEGDVWDRDDVAAVHPDKQAGIELGLGLRDRPRAHPLAGAVMRIAQAALEVLMAKDGLQPLMIRAIAAATKRSKELAK